MVSFFGLKIGGGGDKKKKPAKGVDTPAPRRRVKNPDPLNLAYGDGHFFGRDNGVTGYNPSYAASAYSVSRPDTSHSTKLTRLKSAPHTSESHDASALSMHELPSLPSPHLFRDSSYSILRQHASNPTLGHPWNNGSTASLGPPARISSDSRPSSPAKRKGSAATLDAPVSKEPLSGAPGKRKGSAATLDAPVSRGPSASSLGNRKSSVVTLDAPISRGPSASSLGNRKGSATASDAPIFSEPSTELDSKTEAPPAPTLSPAPASHPSPGGLSPAPKSQSSISKSPLSQYELKLNLPDDGTSMLGDVSHMSNVPEPLRIRKQTPSPQPTESRARSRSPMKPPSPPQSIEAEEAIDYSDLEPPAIPLKHEGRPSSRGSNRSMRTDQEMSNALEKPKYGPASIPSPLSTPRVSEEKFRGALMDELGEPVIQTVRARRDTLTQSSPRRRSLEMTVDDLGKYKGRSNSPASLHRPQTAGRTERPSPLKFDSRPESPDDHGPHTPPYMRVPRPQTAGGKVYKAYRPPPASAVGTPDRIVRPNTSGVHRPAVDEYAYRPRGASTSESSPRTTSVNSHHLRRSASSPWRMSEGSMSESSSYYDDRPESPESPMLPVTGPLASPMFPRLETNFSEPRREAETEFTMRGLSPFGVPFAPREKTDSPELAGPSPLSRGLSNTESADWPLPSPVTTTAPFDFPRMVSPAARSESPFESARTPTMTERPETPLEPLEPPRIPAARSNSPSGFRSFSRPWTPTHEPLRREAASPAPGSTHPKRSETAPVPRPRDASLGPKLPPPRSATMVKTDSGLRSPAIVGNDFGGGGGFI